MNFLSDTGAPAHPAILDALARVNDGDAPSYGADLVSERVKARLADLFETDVEVWLVGSGTAANSIILAALCPPTGAVLCHSEAHIECDERGATAFFTGGAKLSLLPGEHAKISMNALQDTLAGVNRGFVHATPPDVLSLTNLTEAGTAYTPEETSERASAAHAAGLAVHLDGARFANTVLATGATPAELTWRAGVDALSFGATKNGALGCEAIVFFGDRRAERIEMARTHAKRAGHMPAKMRFLAAQIEAYLSDDLWLMLAGDANTAAHFLSKGLTSLPNVTLAHPTDGNEVFVHMPDALATALRDAGAGFYPWLDGSWRFVCSWSTSPTAVDDLLATATRIVQDQSVS